MESPKIKGFFIVLVCLNGVFIGETTFESLFD